MGKTTDRLISGTLTLAALAICASVIYRTFFQNSSGSATKVAAAERLGSWSEALRIGWTVAGDSAAPVTIVELTDLECPACRGYQKTIDRILRDHPHDVRLVYVGFPLEYHQYALAAARGGECAATAGALRQWIGAVFAKQDSLGAKTWASFARDAGIIDTNRIQRCATDTASVSRIQAGLAYGNRIKLSGTPLVIVNGW